MTITKNRDKIPSEAHHESVLRKIPLENIPLYSKPERGILPTVATLLSLEERLGEIRASAVNNVPKEAFFSGDELLVFIISLGGAVSGFLQYFVLVRRVALFGCSRLQRVTLVLAPAAGLLLTFVVLSSYAAQEVRDDRIYFLLFLLLGATWIFWTPSLFPILGLSLRVDALEGHNESAIVALTGAILGISITYAGGNIGEGATIWTTIFSSALATAGLFLLWLMLEMGSRVSLAITEERDRASGWRLAGYLVGIGLILGRAVAGDWTSTRQTIKDFAVAGWPAVVLTFVAIFVEGKWQPNLRQPVPPVYMRGIFPALVYLASVGVVLLFLGRWK
ncbi:MAG: hypothetical protein JWR69_3286 [Pedosphaera sp.]|nr:hypothetical protein [Pedosphaera sp.]